MDAVRKHDITVAGRPDGRPMVFAHGFGCDQRMWRLVAPHFTDDHQVVLFDHVGAGGSDPAAYDPDRYSSLSGYADDVLRICEELGLRDVVFVGHSVSAMIGVLAERQVPELFGKLVLIGPSPRYVDDGDYRGAFSEADVAELLECLDSNYLGWSQAMAPVIMDNADRPWLGKELTSSFCRTDPEVARRFARVTFLSDNRADLPGVTTPTLVVQTRQDAIAPPFVGEYVRDHIPGARYALLDAVGHCPHLSAPDLTRDALDRFVRR